MSRPVGAGGATLLLVAVAAFFGGRLFLVAVLLLAVVALLQMSAWLDEAGARPIVVAAAVAGVGMPVRASLVPDEGLAALPGLMAAMVLFAFVLLIVAGRRRQATAALGATSLCGLLVGLGAGSLVLLGQPDHGGWRWVAGVVAAIALAEVVARVLAPRPLPGSPVLRATAGTLAAAPAVHLVATALRG